LSEVTGGGRWRRDGAGEGGEGGEEVFAWVWVFVFF